MKRRLTILLAGSMVLMVGCGSQKENVEEKEQAIYVATAKPEVGELVLQNRFIGNISPAEQVMILPLVSGEVTETFFEVGDTVHAGDVLFQIDDEAAQMQLEQAQIGVQNAKLQKENAEIARNTAALGVDSSIQSAHAQLDTQQDLQIQQQLSQIDSLQRNLDNLYLQLDSLNLQIEGVYYKWTQADKNNQPTAEIENSVAQMKKQKEQLELQIEGMKKQIQDTNDMYVKQNTQVYEETRQQMATKIVSSQYQEQQAGVNVKVAEEGIVSAKQAVDNANFQLSHYSVTSPIDGVIDSKNVSVHGFANAGNAAYVISDKSSMEVTFQVSEAVKNTLHVGDAITVERNGVAFDATITEVGIAISSNTGLFQIKGSVHANGDALPNGVSVTVLADTYRAENSLLVPYGSIYYESGKAYLYVMKDGTAVKTYVETGIFDEETIVITDGITAEDECIISWSPQLADGVMVTNEN